MSLPKGMTALVHRRALLAAGLAAVSVAVAGCTVRPLYSDAPLTSASGVSSTMKAELASIAIKPPETRYEQQVRNQLIFLFGNGAGEAKTPVYTLEMKIRRRVANSAIVQITSDDDEPSAGNLTLTARYRLTVNATGKRVASGTRSAIASFDQPTQKYAVSRAIVDAENRAARELAEFLRLAIAQDLANKGKPGVDTFDQEEVDPDAVIQKPADSRTTNNVLPTQ